jgi:hypothetical protein
VLRRDGWGYVPNGEAWWMRLDGTKTGTNKRAPPQTLPLWLLLLPPHLFERIDQLWHLLASLCLPHLCENLLPKCDKPLQPFLAPALHAPADLLVSHLPLPLLIIALTSDGTSESINHRSLPTPPFPP